MKLLLYLVGFLAISASAETPQESPCPPCEGSYELIGARFDSGDSFHGTIVIETSAAGFVITRVIDGKKVVGTGRIDFTTMDKIPVLSISFKDEGREIEGTYQFHADLDNYGRITGYVYPKDRKAKQPGLEALFAAKKWPVSGD